MRRQVDLRLTVYEQAYTFGRMKRAPKRVLPAAQQAYKNAADRVRMSMAQPMDVAVCAWWSEIGCLTEGVVKAQVFRSIYDLPVARAMHEADRKDMGHD
jgi:hypothetical protein